MAERKSEKEDERMKKILFILFITALLSACATTKDFNWITGPVVTPEMEKVVPISDTNACRFIKAEYFEISQPSWIMKWAARVTVAAGGDAYKIITTNAKPAFGGIVIHSVNIAIYRCKEGERL